MMCPICHQFLIPERTNSVTDAYYRFKCNCLNHEGAATFSCYTTENPNEIIEYNFSKDRLLFMCSRGGGWNIYCSDPIGEGEEALNPAQGYEVFQRYKRLLMFS